MCKYDHPHRYFIPKNSINFKLNFSKSRQKTRTPDSPPLPPLPLPLTRITDLVVAVLNPQHNLIVKYMGDCLSGHILNPVCLRLLRTAAQNQKIDLGGSSLTWRGRSTTPYKITDVASINCMLVSRVCACHPNWCQTRIFGCLLYRRFGRWVR